MIGHRRSTPRFRWEDYRGHHQRDLLLERLRAERGSHLWLFLMALLRKAVTHAD